METATSKFVSCISHAEIERGYGKTLAQLLNEQAGIVVNGAYQPTGTLVSIYMEGTLGGRTMVLLDGVPIWDPSGISDYFDINFISLYNIERIDIYRGSQSTLFGGGAMAGAINIITRKDKTEKAVNLEAVQSLGNENTWNSHVQIWGKQKKISYAASYFRLQTSGFSYANDSTSKQGFDKDSYKGYIANARLEYAPSAYWTMKAYCLFSRYRADSDVNDFIDDPYYFYTNNNLITGTDFKYHKKKWLVAGNYQYGSTKRDYDYTNYSSEHYGGKTHFAALYMQVSIAKNISLLAGADYRYGHLDYSNYDSSTGQGTSFYPSVSQYASYANLGYANKDSSLNIGLGGRLNKHSAYGYTHSFSFDVAYRYHHVQLSGNIATGYKNPSIYQLYNDIAGNAALSPEQSVSYRMCIQHKQGIFIQQLQFFYRTINNMIDFNGTSSGYSNYAGQKVGGIEYEWKVKLSPHISFTGNYTFLSGNETTNSRINYTDTVTYTYLIRRPKHIANIGLHYTSSHFSAAITGRYVGNYYDVGYGEPDFAMKHFMVVNAYASFNIQPHFLVYMNAQNITNHTFFDIRGYNSIPLLINGGVRYIL
ncbi:TonB-dependent receptor plug domain-containing protein [Parasediminibacterium sp. JCM 36343]|uniref:TonB-dependent receptor plug domain-containing protein n=1 Tax=Parasediminibacterium sp. JCM 36343 TaxID=3374279 RepID=UPI00397BF0A7